jgi:hypothetical protein
MLRDLAKAREERHRQEQQRLQQLEAGMSRATVSGEPRQPQLQQQQQPGLASASEASEPPGLVSVLSYNVWFKEEVALEDRMQGLAAVIEESGFPDFLMLQV